MEHTITANNQSFKSYLIFWSGQLFSLLGSSVSQFVIVWWITITTESAVMLSIASFLHIIPLMIMIPIAGVLADRYDRKKMIIIVDSCQALTTLSIILLFNLEMANPIVIMLINSLRGVFQGFHMPTVSAIIPTMVPKEKLSRLNGINYLFTSFINVIGPIVAATLLALFPIKSMLWMDPITFIIALIPLILIKIPKLKIKKSLDKKSSFGGDLKEGFQTLKLIPVVAMMLITSMFLNFLGRPFHFLRPFFISVTHSGTVEDLAFISASFFGGMFIGAILTSIKKDWKHKITIYFSCNIGLMIPLIINAFSAKGSFLLLAIAAASYGFLLPIINTIYLTMMQMKVPPEKMGRISSIDLILSWALSPIITISAGFLAEFFGIRNLYLYCGITGIFISVILWRVTSVRFKRNNQNIDQIEIFEPEIDLE
jgi:DHA3 family macrolide efflux protein-like MFS transporter